MNYKNRLVFQAVFAFGLVGQLLLITVNWMRMVDHDDVPQIHTHMRHKLLRFGVDRVTMVCRWCDGGDHPLVTPVTLVAAFGGGCDPV